MGNKRGNIEEWLKKIFFGGFKEKYVIYIRFRIDDKEEYRPLPASFIDDVRRGYIVVGDDLIPFHRVVEIRTSDGKIVYTRVKKEEPGLDPST